MKKEQKIALYIHIPFCRKKCPYCSFLSIAYDRKLADSYIELLGNTFPAEGSAKISTIYIGGGTPTVLNMSQLKKLFKFLSKYKSRNVEFTIEANPESITAEKLKLFFDAGVNRLSIGVQSLTDGRLAELGRVHNSETALNAVLLAYRSGFRDINVDFMAGLPKDESDPISKEIKKLTSLPITHFSFYILSYEKGTLFYRDMKSGQVVKISDETASDIYSRMACLLEKKGFRHYEVSNFAKKGFECRHNLNYWSNGPYIGLGPSACSYVNGVRSRNTSDLLKYIDNVRRNRKIISFQEKLSPERRAGETAAFKIRTADGINFAWFKEKTGFDLMETKKGVIDKHVNEGLLRYRKRKGKATGIFITKKGFLLCDLISSSFLN